MNSNKEHQLRQWWREEPLSPREWRLFWRGLVFGVVPVIVLFALPFKWATVLGMYYVLHVLAIRGGVYVRTYEGVRYFRYPFRQRLLLPLRPHFTAVRRFILLLLVSLTVLGFVAVCVQCFGPLRFAGATQYLADSFRRGGIPMTVLLAWAVRRELDRNKKHDTRPIWSRRDTPE